MFNNALPIVFEILARFEEWRTDLFIIQVSVLRSIVLRIVGLYVFFYTNFLNRTKLMVLHRTIACLTDSLCVVLGNLCWAASVQPDRRAVYLRMCVQCRGGPHQALLSPICPMDPHGNVTTTTHSRNTLAEMHELITVVVLWCTAIPDHQKHN